MKPNTTLDNIIRPPLLILSLCFVLVLITESIRKYDIEAQLETGKTSTMSEQTVDARAASLAPLSDYAEVVQRPLFMQDRRPFVPEQVAATNTPVKKAPVRRQGNDNFSLSAIIITDEKRIALIQSGRNKTLQKVAQGEQLEGWTVSDIQAGKISLKRGSETRELELAVKGSPKQSNARNKQAAKAREAAASVAIAEKAAQDPAHASPAPAAKN